RAKLWLQPGRAPLAIVLSGLFAELSELEPFTAQQLLFFHKQGYHVAILPIIGGRSSIEDRSRVLPFDLRGVGKLELGLIHRLLEQIAPERIAVTHLVSVSYGTMIAAVTTALDAESGHPVIDTTTCYSPIYDASQALRTL